MDVQKEARNREQLQTCMWRKEKNDEHLKSVDMPCTILFYGKKNI